MTYDKSTIVFHVKSTHPRFQDLEAITYGRLRVLGFAGTRALRKSQWWCECECGNILSVAACNLKTGHTQSCGCITQEGNSHRTHGLTQHASYATWAGMKGRCYNPHNPKYADYGGRGIQVCDRWRSSFAAFVQDMGDKPSSKHSINRIDNDGDYVPDNCEWALPPIQANNKRNNRVIHLHNQDHTLTEWIGIYKNQASFDTVHARLKNGWDVERALSTPARPMKFNTQAMR